MHQGHAASMAGVPGTGSACIPNQHIVDEPLSALCLSWASKSTPIIPSQEQHQPREGSLDITLAMDVLDVSHKVSPDRNNSDFWAPEQLALRTTQKWDPGEGAPTLIVVAFPKCLSPEGRLSARGSCISVLLPAPQGGSIPPEGVCPHKIPVNKGIACSGRHWEPAGKPGVTAEPCVNKHWQKVLSVSL